LPPTLKLSSLLQPHFNISHPAKKNAGCIFIATSGVTCACFAQAPLLFKRNYNHKKLGEKSPVLPFAFLSLFSRFVQFQLACPSHPPPVLAGAVVELAVTWCWPSCALPQAVDQLYRLGALLQEHAAAGVLTRRLEQRTVMGPLRAGHPIIYATPLAVAAASGALDQVRALLDAGADPSAQTRILQRVSRGGPSTATRSSSWPRVGQYKIRQNI